MIVVLSHFGAAFTPRLTPGQTARSLWIGDTPRSAAPRFLGRISFPHYLVHVPLLYTVFAAAYLALAPVGAMPLLALFASFLATAVCLAWIGEVVVDAPVLRLLARVRGAGSRPVESAAPIIGRP